jgi:hypothetical protein
MYKDPLPPMAIQGQNPGLTPTKNSSVSVVNKSLIIMTTLFIKSLLSSLCQREDLYPSLVKRGKGRFSDLCKFNFETLNNCFLSVQPRC